MTAVFSLILLLGTYACSVYAQGDGGATSSSTTHRCCTTLPLKSTEDMREPGCTTAKCTQAMGLTDFPMLNEVLDGCLREANGNYSYIEKIAKCALPDLARTNYMNFIFNGQEQQQMQSGQPGGNQITAAILGYGCIDTARTTACKSARTILQPTGPSGPGVLGMVAANFTVGGTTASPGMFMRLNLDHAIKQCIASEVGTYASSEWNGGMSQCASISSSSKLEDFVQPSSGSPSCSECHADGLNGDHPFCGNYFSQPGQRRFGARCHKAQSAERIAKAFAVHSHSAGRVQLSSSISIDLTTKTRACQNYLSSLVCETVFGTCSPTTMALARPCKNRCEMELQSQCGMSAAEAASACQAVSATGTGEDCPAPTVPPTTEATAVTPSAVPSVAPTGAYDTVNASVGQFITVTGTGMRNEFRVTFCLTATEAQGIDSGRLSGLLQGAFQEVCEDVISDLEGNQCHMYSLENGRTDQCALQIKVTLSTSPIRSLATPIRTIVVRRTDFKLAPASLMVNTQSVPVTIVRRNVTTSGNSPAAVNTASSLLAWAMLVVAALLF